MSATASTKDPQLFERQRTSGDLGLSKAAAPWIFRQMLEVVNDSSNLQTMMRLHIARLPEWVQPYDLYVHAAVLATSQWIAEMRRWDDAKHPIKTLQELNEPHPASYRALLRDTALSEEARAAKYPKDGSVPEYISHYLKNQPLEEFLNRTIPMLTDLLLRTKPTTTAASS